MVVSGISTAVQCDMAEHYHESENAESDGCADTVARGYWLVKRCCIHKKHSSGDDAVHE